MKAYGVEIRGIYDGVAFWVNADGTITERWGGERGRRIREWIARAPQYASMRFAEEVVEP